MAVTGFNQLLQTMASADFFTGILPFLLSYVLFFLAIKKLNLMGSVGEDNETKFAALISIILAFFVANFIVQNPIYASYFTEYTGRIAIGLIGLLGFMIFVSFVGWEMEDFRRLGFAAVIVIGTIAAFALSGGAFAFIPQAQLPFVSMTLVELVNFTFESGLIWLIAIGAALYWVTSEPSDSGTDWWAPFPGGGGWQRVDQDEDG